MDELMTLEAAAVRLAVSVGSVRKLIALGKLPSVRLTRRSARIPAKDVEAFLASSIATAQTTRAARAAASSV